MYLKPAAESTAESAAVLKMSPQWTLRSNFAVDFVLCGGLPFWWTCGIESTKIELRKATGLSLSRVVPT